MFSVFFRQDSTWIHRSKHFGEFLLIETCRWYLPKITISAVFIDFFLLVSKIMKQFLIKKEPLFNR